jgi:5-methylthioribose kinase
MVEISSLVVSSLTGVFGVVIGAVISNYFNQKIARQSARKDVIFKKRIDYFEMILGCIEKNTELYKNAIKHITKYYNKKEIYKQLKILKNERKKFEVKNSVGEIVKGVVLI